MTAEAINQEIDLLEQVLNGLADRANAAKSTVDTGGSAGPYDEAYLNAAISTIDTNITNKTQDLANYRLTEIQQYLFTTLKFFDLYSIVPTTPGGFTTYTVPADSEGIIKLNAATETRLILETPVESARVFVVYFGEYIASSFNLMIQEADGTTNRATISMHNNSTVAIIIVGTDGSIQHTGARTSIFGKALPFFHDQLIEDDVTDKPNIGSKTRSIVIGDSSQRTDYQRNELFGTIAADSATYNPQGSATFAAADHYTLISDILANADKDLGLIVGNQYGTYDTLSPEYELISTIECDRSETMLSYKKDGKEYVITGGAQFGIPSPVEQSTRINLFEHQTDGSLSLADSHPSYGTGALMLVVQDGLLRLIEFEHRVGTSLDAPVRVFNVNTTINKLELVSSSSVAYGSKGAEHFTYNGVNYFFSWPYDSSLGSSLYQLDSNGILLRITLPQEIEDLTDIKVLEYTSEGLPVIFGVTSTEVVQSFVGEPDASQGITFNTTPRLTFQPGVGDVPADQTSEQFISFRGSDGDGVVLSSPIAKTDPPPVTAKNVMVHTFGSVSITEVTTTLGTYSVIRPFTADGYTYLACLETGPGGKLEIVRHISGATFEKLLTIDLSNPVDVSYSYSNFSHLLNVVTGTGTQVSTYEFRTDKRMLNWIRTSIL